MKISDEYNGVRLDRIIRNNCKGVTLAEIYRAIRTGIIKVNGKKRRQNYRLLTDDEVSIPDYMLNSESVTTKKKIFNASFLSSPFFKQNFNIIYEDDGIIVCNKPVGLVVHGGSGHSDNRTLIDCARMYLNKKNTKEKIYDPQLVHRLDRDTSGVILIAKTRPILRALHENMRKHLFKKQYYTVVHGKPELKKGTIDAPLRRTYEQNNGTKMSVVPNGENAITHYRIFKTNGRESILEVNIETGKTHQIRVHLAHIDCPIIGDLRYGNADKDSSLWEKDSYEKRLYLHAESITFFHPELNREVTFNAILPNSFDKILSR